MDTEYVTRPSSSEHASYFGRYIGLVEGGLFAALSSEFEKTQTLLSRVSEERSLFRYAPGKWSIREVVGHLIDTERIFLYRATRFARGDETDLPGFDEKAYAEVARADARPLSDLLDEFAAVRRSNLFVLQHASEQEWHAVGTANNARVSVRALAFLLVGHVRHHMGILEARYLGADQA